MKSNIFVKAFRLIWPKKSKLDPGVFGTKSIFDKIVFAFALFALICVAALQFYVIFWMCYTAFKDDIDLYLSKFALPKWNALHWENFSNVFSIIRAEQYIEGEGYIEFGFWELLKNSLLLSFLSPIQGSVWSTLIAYVMAKYRFRGRDLFLKVNFFFMVFPIGVSLAASLRLNYAIGRYDNFLMMITTGVGPFSGMGLLIMMSFFNAIPKEMMEAAEIDGAGQFTIFFTIHLPMIFPTVLLYYVLAVFSGWNDYGTPLIWLPSMPNIALGIYQFQYDSAKYAATLPQVLAAFVMMSIPSVIFYLINQKQIMSKMIMTGLKG